MKGELHRVPIALSAVPTPDIKTASRSSCLSHLRMRGEVWAGWEDDGQIGVWKERRRRLLIRAVTGLQASWDWELYFVAELRCHCMHTPNVLPKGLISSSYLIITFTDWSVSVTGALRKRISQSAPRQTNKDSYESFFVFDTLPIEGKLTCWPFCSLFPLFDSGMVTTLRATCNEG